MSGDRGLGARVANFWREPLFNKFNRLSTLYFKAKGALVYRICFRKFGSGSYIRKPLLIENPQFIGVGTRVSIQAGARLEAIQSNPRRVPDLTIGDGTNIEQNVHIVCHSRIYVGRNVSVTGNCCIVDVTHPYSDVGNEVKIGARVQDEDSYVEIGDGSFVGYGAVILPNVRIGRYVVIGANSVVACDIPDYSVVAGTPARVIKRFDSAAGSWIKTCVEANRELPVR